MRVEDDVTAIREMLTREFWVEDITMKRWHWSLAFGLGTSCWTILFTILMNI